MTGGGSLIEKFTELMSENLKVDVKLSSNFNLSCISGGKVLENKNYLKHYKWKKNNMNNKLNNSASFLVYGDYRISLEKNL